MWFGSTYEASSVPLDSQANIVIRSAWYAPATFGQKGSIETSVKAGVIHRQDGVGGREGCL